MHDAMGSGDRWKIILIFGAVLVLSAGGIFYFFKVYQPKERMNDARSEIAAWDARWTEARSCLLGATPGSSKVSEALAIRELSPDPWERKTCTQLISSLSRGEATDTRVPAVEEAWRGLDKAAGKVAVSFISHVDPGGDGMRKKPDPLPLALDELEAAYAVLRKAAELPPAAPPSATAKPLPAAKIEPVMFDGKRVLTVQEPYVTSRAGMLAFGSVDGSEIQLQFVTGKPPAIAAVGAGTQRAIPDGTWGARAIPDAVQVAQIDAKGALQNPVDLKLVGATQVITVVGTWADGVVVYGAGNQLVVARCKAGACTPEKPYTVRSMAFAIDAASGYTLIVFANEKSTMHVLRLDPAALDTKLENLDFDGFPKLVCLAAEDAWMQYAFESTIRTLQLRNDKTFAEIMDDEHALMGCSPGGAVLYDSHYDTGPSYRRCVRNQCEAATPQAQKHRVPVALTPNGIVGVEARGGVLAVRKGGPTDFYAVPNGFVPLVAMTDGGALDIPGWTADGLVIVRASAR